MRDAGTAYFLTIGTRDNRKWLSGNREKMQTGRRDRRKIAIGTRDHVHGFIGTGKIVGLTLIFWLKTAKFQILEHFMMFYEHYYCDLPPGSPAHHFRIPPFVLATRVGGAIVVLTLA